MTTIDIKAAFFDIDGTLTSFTTHVVPQSTIDALRALQSNGVKIFICTGRPPAQMNVVLDTIPVDFDGIVGFNGQYCTDDSGFLEKHTLDATDVATIVRWLDEHEDIVACIGEEDYVYFNHSNDQMHRTWASWVRPRRTYSLTILECDTAKHETFQMSPYISRDQEAELLSLLTNTRGVRWHPDFVDLIPADGGKIVASNVFSTIMAGRRSRRFRSAMAAMTWICCALPASAWRWATPPKSRRRWPITLPMTSIIMVFGMLSSISTSSDDLPLTVFHFTAASRCMRHHKFPIALSLQ